MESVFIRVYFPVECVLRNFMLPEFAFMEPLSPAVVSEVTIIHPAVFSLCDLCVSNLLFRDPAQGLYSPMAVLQCALRTTSAASGRVLAPLQHVS